MATIGKNIFKITSIYDETIYCFVETIVKYKIYENNSEKYNIDFKFNYPNKNSIKAHPFYRNPKIFDDGQDTGSIIEKNSFTEKLVEYLLMDYDKLSQYSGNSSPETYKKILMKQVMMLWD